MSLFGILETLLIGPLKLVFEIIFQYSLKIVGHPGFAIIVLSLVMNILVLPLYKRADAMQEQARDVENKLREGTNHIKKTFSGDERMMMLQTYNRQNNYKPTDVFKGSISLLLEIPFFMAAYQFLSHLETLNGISFGPITDLGKPDALLVIGGITLNALPIIMTLINVISSAIYLKGFPLKTKIQLYGMAAFFLVFLYTSPAGLLFYWTLNNVFSLVKNIFYKIKNPKLVISILAFVAGIAFFALAVYSPYTKRPFIVLGAVLILPLINIISKKIFKFKSREFTAKPNKTIFILGALLLTVFIGVFIPSTYIAASPQEYVDLTYFHNPLLYIANSALLAIGCFVIWLGVFYWLSNDKWKVMFERLVWVLCGVVAVNYMCFGTNLGVLSPTLEYVEGFGFSLKEKLINIAVLLALGTVMFIIVVKFRKITSTVLLTAILAVSLMSGMNVVKSANSVNQIAKEEFSTTPHFELSQEGNNVVVIMLDRAMALYAPYILNEKPELKKSFDGFTFYPNTISFGEHTNIASPAMMGGYEYTPVELNKRKDESLKDKHNESLSVLPVLFSENGYQVTVCDPPYANYQWVPDLSIYKKYPAINAFVSKGVFGDRNVKQRTIDSTMRNFFCFSVMKSMPVILQNAIYDNSAYNRAVVPAYAITQEVTSMSTSTGVRSEFMNSYNAMDSLDIMTQVSSGKENNFVFIANDMTHDPAMLSEPDYVPSAEIDNTKYDAENADRYTLNGETLSIY
ncbi:MAG: YidC/Oxa1 family membrane protein insertase, partial [Clostridia bacterium]|nr:YidC/Oxa1 family membrane protein insertase [Clostridia bacterium]